VPLKTWNQYVSDGAVKLGQTIVREVDFEAQTAHLRSLINAGELLPLLIEQEQRLQVVPADIPWQVGDRLIYLLHAPKPKLLKLLSGSSPTRLSLETLPEVEKIPAPPETPPEPVPPIEQPVLSPRPEEAVEPSGRA
jgi:hypothetical protein